MASISSHISVLALFVSAAHSSSISSIDLSLIPRDSSCPANTTACPGFPSDFCCQTGTSCLAVDNRNTVICCPDGENCQGFKPITCDIQAQNATTHPDNPVLSINLDQPLPPCGNLCCPGGYTCQNGDTCALLPDPSSSTPGAANSTSSSTPNASTNPALSSTSPSPSPSSNPAFPAKAIFAGFFPGLFLGIILSILGVICLGRKRKTTSISSPILQQGNCRTDFLRSSPASRPERRLTVRSLFRRDTHKSNASSGEEISVFAPNLGDDHHYQRDSAMTHKTTFTDLMNSAEMRKHEQYMPSAGVTPPVPTLNRDRYT